jgi:hypothetical protein
MSSPGLAPPGQTVEEPPRARSTIRLWVQLLVGPVLWISHFMVVYLFAEAACVARESDALPVPGSSSIVPVVVVATVVAAALTAAATAWTLRTARRSRGDAAAMAWAGTLLAAMSVVAILAVGLPAAALDPC